MTLLCQAASEEAANVDTSAVEGWGGGGVSEPRVLASELTHLSGLISEAGLEEIMTPPPALCYPVSSPQDRIWSGYTWLWE